MIHGDFRMGELQALSTGGAVSIPMPSIVVSGGQLEAAP